MPHSEPCCQSARRERRERRRRWVDPPGHDFFFVLETDNYEALVGDSGPIIPSGTATIQPVGDMGATVLHGCRRN